MKARIGLFILIGLGVSLILAFGVSRYASTKPDGLTRVAADHRLDSEERPHHLSDSPFAGYETRGIASTGTGKGVAGIAGVLVVFALAGAITFAATRSHKRETAEP